MMASRTYALLLRCFPRDFRERHAAAMAAQFDEQYRVTAGRPLARALLWVRVVGDAVRHGWALRLGSGRPPGPVSPTPADVRHAWHSLRARPAHAFMCIGLLAVALSVSTAVFVIVDAAILRPLPFPDPDSLVEICNAETAHKPDNPNLPPDLARAWEAQTSLFTAAGTLVQGFEAVIGGGDTTRESVGLAYTTPGLFPTLDIRPVAGRTFIEGEGQPGRDRVVVIGESIWQARFNRDPGAIGQPLLVNDVPETVIGVMPASFAYPFSSVKLWLPYDLTHPAVDRFTEVVGRSRFGHNYPLLDDHVAALAPGILSASPKPREYSSASFLPLRALRFMPDQTRQSILVLAGATLLLLLTAAANLSTLTLTQMLARTRHTAIQSALGASRARLVRQALIEQLFIGLGALALGAPLTMLAVLGVQRLGPDILTVWTMHVVALDARGVVVLGTLALATPVLTGLVPAVAGSRRSVADLLKQDTRASSGSRASRALRRLLVTIEIVCAVVLLVAGALLIRSFLRLEAVNRGFATTKVVYAAVNFPAHAFTSPLARRLFSDEALAHLSATPGIDAATLTAGVPPSHGELSSGKIALDGQPPAPHGLVLPGYVVRPDFFVVTGIPIVQGRPFTANEPPESVVVSQSFAAAMWPGTSPLGHRFRLDERWPWKNVVGVAGEVRSQGLDDARTPFVIYYPYPRPALDAVSTAPETVTGPYSGHAMFLAHTANATAAIPAVRAALQKVDARILVDKVDTVESLYQDTLNEPRMLLVLMAVFSGAGLLVAGIGVYSVLSTLVAQQLREIGVRLMLGAEPSAMARRVFRGGLALAGVGLGVGLAAAALSSRILSGILFGVQGMDIASYVVVVAVIGAATLAAAWMPARRAALVDPADLVRET